MFMFGLVQVASCLIEQLSQSNEYKAVSYVVSEANTVHFIQSEVKEKSGNGFKPLSDGVLTTKISVYKGKLGDKRSLLHLDEKSSEQNTFFFTTPSRETYYIVLEPATNDELLKKSLGVDYRIYVGESNRPGIVSNNDVEVSRAESMIKRVLEFVQKNISVQSMGEDDENIYKGIYEDIMRKAFYFVVVRFLSTGFTMFYSNHKTKSFYASQNIGLSK